ncbi:MAG: putative Flp pilus-assembly TadE/G-like [Actinomycetota bacterium]|jgi:Flp pilus assembly protein TadG
MPAPEHLPNNVNDRGSIVVIFAAALLPICLMMAIVVDGGRVWLDRTRLQNGVEAGAVASARTWNLGGASCASTSLAIVSTDGASPTSLACSVTGTRTNGVLTVSGTDASPLHFASLIGRSSSKISARTSVRIGPVGGMTKLWPFALCKDNPAVATWVKSGMTSTAITTIVFEDPSVLCAGSVSGNWSTLDYNGGANSTVEINDWITNGYTAEVKVGDVIQGAPGAPSATLQITPMIGKSVLMPLYTNPRMQGANAVYTVAGFAQVKVVAASFSGANSKRSLTIQFQKGSVTGSSVSFTAPDFGLSAIAICSHDTQGVCS